MYIIKANVKSSDGIVANVSVETDRTDGYDPKVAANIVGYKLGLENEKIEIESIEERWDRRMPKFETNFEYDKTNVPIE